MHYILKSPFAAAEMELEYVTWSKIRIKIQDELIYLTHLHKKGDRVYSEKKAFHYEK